MPSDMGIISLVGALCQVLLCQQPDQFRCKNFKPIEEDPLGSSSSSSMGTNGSNPHNHFIFTLKKKSLMPNRVGVIESLFV
jgi:hypothetical protein